jgi:hypothetical protein
MVALNIATIPRGNGGTYHCHHSAREWWHLTLPPFRAGMVALKIATIPRGKGGTQHCHHSAREWWHFTLPPFRAGIVALDFISKSLISFGNFVWKSCFPRISVCLTFAYTNFAINKFLFKNTGPSYPRLRKLTV